nr:uncharacterized protein LOC123276313 [Equus asinus]
MDAAPRQEAPRASWRVGSAGCVAGEGGTGCGATSRAGSGFWGPPRQRWAREAALGAPPGGCIFLLQAAEKDARQINPSGRMHDRLTPRWRLLCLARPLLRRQSGALGLRTGHQCPRSAPAVRRPLLQPRQGLAQAEPRASAGHQEWSRLVCATRCEMTALPQGLLRARADDEGSPRVPARPTASRTHCVLHLQPLGGPDGE